MPICVVNGVANIISDGRPVVLTIGFFDGVHRGHRQLIETVVKFARENNARPVVLTFDSHPYRVVCPHKLPPIIMTLTERIQKLEDLGVECIVVQSFDEKFAALSAQEFLEEIIVKKFDAKIIVGGYDCKFGHNREGSHELFRKNSLKFGYKYFDMPPLTEEEGIISSSEIRKAILAGDLNKAEYLLGRPWSIWSHIVEGHGIGRTMGYPTANLDVGYLAMPKAGVYASYAFVNGKRFKALTYVGTRPTFAQSSQKTVCEVYLTDFAGDLYQEWIRVQPVGFIREDIQFESPDELKLQIKKDLSNAEKIWLKKEKENEL